MTAFFPSPPIAGDLPYCGAPATPLDLWSRWTLEPELLIGLAVLGGFALTTAARSRRWSAISGWGVLVVAFVSPLCALSMALFAARMGQHLLLTLVAAPLLVWGFGLNRHSPPVLPAAALFALLFWVWHAPAPYAATLSADWLYWTMHLSLLGAACGLWAALIGARPSETGWGIVAAVATGAQMSILAVLLALSAEPWHLWHVAGARSWGLTALQDQQLAAGLAWVLGALSMAVVVGIVTLRWVRLVDAGPVRPASP